MTFRTCIWFDVFIMQPEPKTPAPDTNETAPAVPVTPVPAAAPLQEAKKPSHKPSITGIVLAVLSLISSGIANFSINAKYSPTGPTTGSVEAEVGHAVGTGTTTVLGALLGVPFLVGAIGLGLLSLVFIAIRFPKLRAAGFIFSALAVAIVVWSISMALGNFEQIKADPA